MKKNAVGDSGPWAYITGIPSNILEKTLSQYGLALAVALQAIFLIALEGLDELFEKKDFLRKCPSTVHPLEWYCLLANRFPWAKQNVGKTIQKKT